MMKTTKVFTVYMFNKGNKEHWIENKLGIKPILFPLPIY